MAKAIVQPRFPLKARSVFDLSRKSAVIVLRWPVVLVSAYLLVGPGFGFASPGALQLVALVYVLSNAVLHRVEDKLFDAPHFYIPLVLFDTLFLTASMIVSGRAGTDFYLTYFLIVILCSVWQDFLWSIALALLMTLLYAYILFTTAEARDPSIYIRFPFLFIVAIFYGYFGQMVRAERALKEQAEVDRWKAVANLAAGVAHEVKNPLAILLQGIDYLSKREALDPLYASLVLDDMKDAVRRANAVIRGLMDFSVVSRLALVEENLNTIVESSLLLFKNHLDRHHARVVKDLSEDLPPVKADRTRLEQVFINLFMNAIEAMPDGGQLTVRTYAMGSREDGAVVAEVENEGPSIPEEILPRIFEPFFTTKRASGGTGLGLAVVKTILDSHAAKIEVCNRDKGGVKVILHFQRR